MRDWNVRGGTLEGESTGTLSRRTITALNGRRTISYGVELGIESISRDQLRLPLLRELSVVFR